MNANTVQLSKLIGSLSRFSYLRTETENMFEMSYS